MDETSKPQDTEQEQIATDDKAHTATELPGRRLRETREDSHLSRDEVANHLRLDVQLIEALEEDEYANLPSAAYICGYLRSYARLLKLPEDEIVQAYSHGEQINAALIPDSVKIQPIKSANTSWLKTIIILVIVVLVGAGLYYFIKEFNIFGSNSATDKQTVKIQQHSELSVPPAAKPVPKKTNTSSPTADSKQQAPTPTPIPAKNKAKPVVTTSKPQTGKTIIEKLPTPKTKIPASEPDVATGQAATNTSKPTATATTPTTPTKTPVTQINNTTAAMAVLRMHFTDSSWTEVTDSTNKRLVYRLVEKGSDLFLNGVPPFTIRLGNAAAVQVFYKGKEFDHSNYPQNHVVSFKIGAE